MFGRKSDPPEMKIENDETAKACESCGCVVLTAKLKVVKYWYELADRTCYYCGRCAPAYDRMHYDMDREPHYFRRIPERSIEVTEEGKEIKLPPMIKYIPKK